MKELLTRHRPLAGARASGWPWPGSSASRAPDRGCPGAAMVVSDDGEVAGSVSGGCVEGAVVTEALDVLAGTAGPGCAPSATPTTRPSPSGLTCGGTIRIFVEPLDW